jgi:hypothetical protein
MSHRIADGSAEAARSFYSLRRMTDNVLSASLGQLTGFLERSALKRREIVQFLLGPFHSQTLPLDPIRFVQPGAKCCNERLKAVQSLEALRRYCPDLTVGQVVDAIP